jgi:hypothetical protein
MPLHMHTIASFTLQLSEYWLHPSEIEKKVESRARTTKVQNHELRLITSHKYIISAKQYKLTTVVAANLSNQ